MEFTSQDRQAERPMGCSRRHSLLLPTGWPWEATATKRLPA